MLKRPWLIVLISPFVLLLAWIGLCLLFCQTGTAFEFKCRYYVHIGMTVKEAESVLGTPEEESWPPYEKDVGPVVTGHQYFVWHGPVDLHVGVRNGKICSKWVWVPSL
jgi:hypothetical protein